MTKVNGDGARKEDFCRVNQEAISASEPYAACCRYPGSARSRPQPIIMQDAFWLLGSHLTILANQQTTAGQYDLIEDRFAPSTAVPLHRHTTYAEQVYVLEGEFTVLLDGVSHVLRKGGNIVIPVGTPHSLIASSHETTVALTVAFPSGFARLIQEVGIPALFGESVPSSPLDMQLFMQLAAELGDEML